MEVSFKPCKVSQKQGFTPVISIPKNSQPQLSQSVNMINENVRPDLSKCLFSNLDVNVMTSMLQAIQNIPEYTSNVNYFQEFWKLYIQNELLLKQLSDFMSDKKDIVQRIQNLEKAVIEKSELSDAQQKKKNRRCASEIEKAYVCPYESCQKGYGSDVSLNLHIKLKHNGGSKTERERLARALFLAKMNKEELPRVDIDFPPGYLENFEQYLKKEPEWRRNKDELSTQSESCNHIQIIQQQ